MGNRYRKTESTTGAPAAGWRGLCELWARITPVGVREVTFEPVFVLREDSATPGTASRVLCCHPASSVYPRPEFTALPGKYLVTR